MKISIITVVRNQCAAIEDCLKSVLSQTHRDVEYIVIDGVSTDGTLEILKRYQARIAKIISEKDAGPYDAMNKGIRLATGDVVGILNSDDFYADSRVLEKVANAFKKNDAEALFADLVYVRPGDLNRVVRFYSGAGFTPDKFAWGWMPQHPTFFVRRHLYEQYGLFRTDYRIAADYELMARFLARNKARYVYLPEVIVRMRTGGLSTRNLRSNWILNREILRACAENGIPTNILKVYSKYFRKLMQLFERPS
ncbi:MAG: glycosyltransferase family 2 protein [Candidatus Omnitrophica bacterium]|nr:glycosyltransferase family 2 protein [Candidatus Omnitrophota bacterium]